MQMLMDYITSLGGWAWFLLGLVLFALETVVPGVHFLWFGVAAAIVGVIALATGITWVWQWLAFAVIAFLTVGWVRRYAAPDRAKSDTPDLNIRGMQYIGRKVVVEVAIKNGRGKVRVGDTVWNAEGEDAPAGAEVVVTGVNGTNLVVENIGEE
jgi:inner membrane protein